jgi:hypothetical protein
MAMPWTDCKNCIEVPVPPRCRFDLKIDIGPENATFFLATVDLGRLGRRVGKKAKRGKINSIYVLGKMPEETDSDVE